jgi:predicted amidohydrolase
MTRPLTLALAQFAPKIGDLETNLDRIARVTREAARQQADMVVFPELALTGYHQELLGDRLVKLAFTTEDEPIQRLARLAQQENVYLVAGFLQKGHIPGVLYNSIVYCSPDGAVIGSYAKSHLFSGENLYFRPGLLPEPFDTRYGKVGPMICMDIGFPEVARILCLQGAELLIAPSAWILEDQDIWPRLLQSRALDNIAFVAGINRVGTEGNLRFIGQSMVVDPRGGIIARLDGEEGLLVTTIDLDSLTPERRRAPRFTGRRPELYGAIADPEANSI